MKKNPPIFQKAPLPEEVFHQDNLEKFKTLVPWQQQFLKVFLESGDIEKASRSAGLGIDTKRAAYLRLKAKKSLKESLIEIGIDTDFIAEKIREALSAEKIFIKRDGEQIVNPDYPTRMKAIELVDRIFSGPSFTDDELGKSKEQAALEMFKEDIIDT